MATLLYVYSFGVHLSSSPDTVSLYTPVETDNNYWQNPFFLENLSTVA